MKLFKLHALQIAKLLKEKGFSTEQAEVLVEVMEQKDEEKLDAKLNALRFQLVQWIIGTGLAVIGVQIGLMALVVSVLS